MHITEEAIVMWETFRSGVIAELENIPEEQWDNRAGDGGRSLRETARHIAESGVAFVGEIVAADGKFARVLDPKHQESIRAGLPTGNSKADIIEMLKSTCKDGVARLRQKGDALQTDRMPMLGSEGSRLSGLIFAISHEMYHRGQLAMFARAAGQTPALTQQINAMMGRR
jgi:uncharacterized damage-inducible protein DinB